MIRHLGEAMGNVGHKVNRYVITGLRNNLFSIMKTDVTSATITSIDRQARMRTYSQEYYPNLVPK
jgi:hypothetical protein